MKRLTRILGWIAGVVIILLLLAIVGLWLFFPIEKAKEFAIEKGSAQLGRNITIDDAQVSFWGGIGVKLGNVAISNPPDMEDGSFLTADNVDVKLRILPLFSGDFRIDKLVVNRPRISMRKEADGSNNYTFESLEKKAPPELVQKATPETKAAAAAVTFDRLEINEGYLSYVDDSSASSFDLRGLDLSTSLKAPRKNYYESSGVIAIDSLLVAGEKPLPVLSVKLDYHAAYDLDQKQLTFDETGLELNALKFTLEGTASDPAGDLKSKVNLKSQKIKVADLLNLLPEKQLEMTKDIKVDGDFSLDLDVEYDTANTDTLTYFGTAIITSMNLSHSEVPGKFRFSKALIDFKNDNLRFTIEDGYFDDKPLKGHLVVENFEDPVVNGELAGNFNLVYLQPFLPAEDAHEIAGAAEFNIKLSGKTNDFTQMNFSGDLKVVDGKYNSSFMLEPIESFNLDVYFDRELTSVKKLDARTSSGSLGFTGRLNKLVPYLMADSTARPGITPTIDGVLDGRLNLDVVNSLLPPKGNPHLEGDLALNLKLAGVLADYEKLQPSGTVTIKNASYSDSLLPEPLRHFEADLKVAPDTITVVNMTAQFVSSDASFSGKLINPFPYLLPLKTIDRSNVTKPLFLFKLTSHRFDADKLFPEAVPGSGETMATASMDSVSTIILPDIDGQGTFEVDTLIYSRVEFTSLQGKIKIYDRKIECYDATGKVYSGDVAGNTTIDLNDFENPRYTGEFQATNVEANDFVSRFTKFGGFLYGKINLDGQYAAEGWEPEDFLNSLTMNSNTSMQQGKVITSGEVYSAINSLASKAGQSFDKEQPLRSLATKVIVKDGKVGVDKLKTQLGSMGEVELDGYYSFDGDIDYTGTILLSKEWSQKLVSSGGLLGNVAGLLSDKSVDRIKLPIGFGGTLDKPAVAIDYSALGKNLQDNLKGEAQNVLDNLLKKKK
ncbi:MAG: AsmA family protein [Candidatus Zixiibacteriota bacterium]